MRAEFTPGADRAIAAASGWISFVESDELGLPEVLMGLLSEPECRAALLLARFHIDQPAVRQRFPSLRELPGSAERPASPAWTACLQAVEDLLEEYPRPLELATEHLLLGLAATENEVSRWFAECGLYADALEAEIHHLAGHHPGPLPLDPLDESDADDDTEPTEPPCAAESHAASFVRVFSEEEPALAKTADEIAALRIIDAAANRASEGLRVIEDYLRFGLDDRHLTELCKQVRHDLTAALAVFTAQKRDAARETRGDVGTDVSLAAEQTRTRLAEVVTAGFKRVEQALRSLEEYAKLSSAETAARLEQLRYQVYTLERAAGITARSIERLSTARLYVLIDGGLSEAELVQRAEELVEAGVSVLQLRDKALDDHELLARARCLRQVTRDSETLFVMNDRADLAVLSGADGVHLGQEDLCVKDARRILGAEGLIGVSTHSLEQARAAVLDGADYIGVGPTFPSGTKQFKRLAGVELLTEVAAEIRLPSFAIGGINPQNLDQVLAAGMTRIAVSGAVTSASDPPQAAAELRSRLEQHAHSISARS